MQNHSFKKLFKTLLFILVPGLIYAQQNNRLTVDTLISEPDTTSFNFLMIGLSYTSNNIKYKSYDNNIKMPAYSAEISYYHKSGLWTTASRNNYVKDSIPTHELELQLGYQHTFYKFIDIDISYGYHDFKGDEKFEGISYNHILQGSLMLNSKYVSFNTDLYSMIGPTNNFFIDLGISLNLDFDGLVFKNDFFMFDPNISFSFGTNDWTYQNFSYQQRKGRMKFFTDRGYKPLGFAFQNLAFYFPLIYSLNNFSFSFNWFYSIPSDKMRAIDWNDQSGFLISIIYSPTL